MIVCEVDPLRALEARMAGYQVMTALEAAERGDIFITVTGSRRVLRREHFERMKDGALLANAGHFDVELDLGELAELATGGIRAVRPLVEEYTLADGRRLNLLAHGRVVNLAAAEGHPAAVMDVSFALQALGVEELVRHGAELSAGVHPVPAGVDREVGRLKLAALGVRSTSRRPSRRTTASPGAARPDPALGYSPFHGGIRRTGLRGGIDLGGTKIEAIIVDAEQKVLGQARQPTPTEGGPADVATSHGDGAPGGGEGRGRQDLATCSASASVRPATSTRRRARSATRATCPGGPGTFELAATLSEQFGTTVHVGNDVQVATQAEFEFGAGKPYTRCSA